MHTPWSYTVYTVALRWMREHSDLRGHVGISEDIVGSHTARGYYWYLVRRVQHAVTHGTTPLAPENCLVFLKLILKC